MGYDDSSNADKRYPTSRKSSNSQSIYKVDKRKMSCCDNAKFSITKLVEIVL